LKERGNYKDLKTDGMKNINMNLKEIILEGVGCVDLVQNREQRRAFVNTVMNHT
jgi:hypothetical protein